MKDTLPINRVICGDNLKILPSFPANSIDCIITSVPYWGLRDYGEEANKIWDGDKLCEHQWNTQVTKRDNLQPSKVGKNTMVGSNKNLAIKTGEMVSNSFCIKCNAWYGQLGLEPTLDMYIDHLLLITKELKRVLKPTGVLWWNHGDCYGL